MNSLPPDARDQHGWNDRIFRCLAAPSEPEDAATAAAAAWLMIGCADAATVVLFESASRYVRATGALNGHGVPEIGIDFGHQPVTALFAPEDLFIGNAEVPAATYLWPDRLAACGVTSPAASIPDHARVTVARILERATTQQTIVPDAEHMESLAEFAAGAGHEINNPLGSIIGQTQLLLKQEDQTDRRQSLSTIGAQAWRIRDMIGDCMLFARPPAAERDQCNLSSLIREAAEKAAQSLDEPADHLEFRLPDGSLSADVDATQIRTLVTHLIRNSIEAGRESDMANRVTVELEADRNAVMLTIEDRGPGIGDEQIRRHLFDPFYSGRQAGRGIGFGLPVCWQIARNHGGLILCETPDTGGTRFVTAFPVS